MLLETQQNINSNHSNKMFHGFLLKCPKKLGISDVIARSTYKWPFNHLWALSLEDLNHRVKHHHWARNNKKNQPLQSLLSQTTLQISRELEEKGDNGLKS